MIIIISTLNAQYSTYYNVNENVKVSGNVNVNVNENVKVSGTVNQNITTIDYGKLALANAENEKTRLQNLIYADQKAKEISLEIASDPTNAYKYGFQYTFECKGELAKQGGFRKYSYSYVIPNEALFVNAGAGRFENVSNNGVTTEFTIFLPEHTNQTSDIEKLMQNDSIKVGKLNFNGKDSVFVYKKEVNRATVSGSQGYSNTIVWEDKYQFYITNNYSSIDINGIVYKVRIKCFGDKDDITFEQLEGRRYYLKPLMEKIISTALISDFRFSK
jgi:hypothetical protein